MTPHHHDLHDLVQLVIATTLTLIFGMMVGAMIILDQRGRDIAAMHQKLDILIEALHE